MFCAEIQVGLFQQLMQETSHTSWWPFVRLMPNSSGSQNYLGFRRDFFAVYVILILDKFYWRVDRWLWRATEICGEIWRAGQLMLEHQTSIYKSLALNDPFLNLSCPTDTFLWFWTRPKLYIPSTLNFDLILWHTQLIVCAVKY